MREADHPLEQYLLQHTSEPEQLLLDLERETYLKTLAPQMMSGRRLGQFLRQISMIARPRTVLEIGTFTGYGTLCLAAGLHRNGEIHTIESNQELGFISTQYLQRSEHRDQIHQHIGDALDILPLGDLTWDLVFIDGAKKQYLDYYEKVIQNVRSGGILIADNVLWGGKVVLGDGSEETKALQKFNTMVQGDERVTNLMMELRDGLLLCQKK